MEKIIHVCNHCGKSNTVAAPYSMAPQMLTVLELVESELDRLDQLNDLDTEISEDLPLPDAGVWAEVVHIIREVKNAGS